MNPERDRQITNFLKDNDWGDATRNALVADASFRSYERINKNTKTAILMNAPPAQNEPVSIFVDVTNMLLGFGLSAPRIYAKDIENGLLLIEDLGDDLVAKICTNTPTAETKLYSAAIDVLLSLHQRPAPEQLPPYDMAVYLREASLITQWYRPAVLGEETSPQLQAEFETLIKNACHNLGDYTPCLVMRDYHAENLLWLPERSGINRLGLLDYQDALAGHPAYDLVSLLEDARRDTSDELRQLMFERYLANSAADPTEFSRAYSTLGAQRNLKIIGIFSRLCIRDAKPHYLELIPRVWAHLMRDLSHPDLADLKSWVSKNIPTPDKAALDKVKQKVAHA